MAWSHAHFQIKKTKPSVHMYTSVGEGAASAIKGTHDL